MSLTLINDKLQSARISADIFGILSGDLAAQLSELKTLYHQMAKATHADLFDNVKDKEIAHEAFIKVKQWYELAVNDLETGNYGKKKSTKVKTKRNTYIIYDLFRTGNIADVYDCVNEKEPKKPLILKVVRNVINNDLINAEINALKKLYTHTGPFLKVIDNHITKIIETFEIDGKQAIVLEKLIGFYSLEDVIKVYPNGIDPKDMAWMFRRLLSIQGALHALGIVHGNILPQNFMICPENHNGKLIGLSNTVGVKGKIKMIDSNCKDFYAPEILNKAEVTSATDIYMSALCMVKVLGGNVKTREMPAAVPRAIQGFLKGCLIENPHRRFNNALDLHGEFGYTLKEIWKPEFHKFEMPVNS